MSINIKIIQRKDKASKSNTAPIHIRFTLKGKVRYLATGVVLPLGAWNDTEQHIIPSYPDSEVLQMQITAKRLEIEKKIQRLEALDTEKSALILCSARKAGTSTALSPNTSSSR